MYCRALLRQTSRSFYTSSRANAAQYRYLPGSAGSSRFKVPVYVYVLGAGGGTWYITHLERVPETNRLRFIDTSESSEREMGEQAAQQVLQQYKGKILSARDPRTQQVNRVVKRLLRASGLDKESSNTLPSELQSWHHHAASKTGIDWRVYVINDETQNAFVLPNGSIFVFSGILPLCENEDGLAVVLGHEISHQIARHSGERMSGQKVSTFVSVLLASMGFDFYSSSSALQLLMTLPNSRKQETEADRIGLKLAAAACYDPSQAVPFWQRMGKAAAEKGSPPSFLSTHPADSTRVKDIQSWLPEVMQLRSDRCGVTTQFLSSPYAKSQS